MSNHSDLMPYSRIFIIIMIIIIDDLIRFFKFECPATLPVDACFSMLGRECIDDLASVPPVQHGQQRSFYRHFEEVHGGRNFDPEGVHCGRSFDSPEGVHCGRSFDPEGVHCGRSFDSPEGVQCGRSSDSPERSPACAVSAKFGTSQRSPVL